MCRLISQFWALGNTMYFRSTSYLKSTLNISKVMTQLSLGILPFVIVTWKQ